VISAWQELLAAVPGGRPLPETSAVLAGARDFEPPEERRLRDSQITQIEPGRLRSPEALAEVPQRKDGSGQGELERLTRRGAADAEDDSLERGLARKVPANPVDLDLGGLAERKAADPGPEGDQGE
jgi:hypothetical protein